MTGPVAFAIDGKDETAWGIDIGPERRNQPRNAVFTLAKPIELPGGLSSPSTSSRTTAAGTATTTRTTTWVDSGSPSRPRPMPRPTRSLPSPQDPGNRPRTAQPGADAPSFRYWRTTVPGMEGREQLDRFARAEASGRARRNWCCASARSRERPTSCNGVIFSSRARPSRRACPRSLSGCASAANPSRLTFAKWLASRESPTTARSLVNRVWQAYFGTGIVATSEDLGVQCEPPSHPELLDWLAVEFMESGWSLKHLHRLIANSATYRQSSRVTAPLLARDPYNRLLARGPRFRVDAEMVRDIALSASGLLDPKIGGPSVCPPAPAFLFQPPVSYGPKVWNEAIGIERYRRAFYTFRYRSVPYPMLQAFDAPNGDFACVRRSRSNTPLQALTTLNEPIYLECARALAFSVLERGGSHRFRPAGLRIQAMPARAPSDAEKSTLLELLENRRGGSRPREPTRGRWPPATGEAPQLPAGVKPADLAGWTVVARVLLNLDETITKE